MIKICDFLWTECWNSLFHYGHKRRHISQYNNNGYLYNLTPVNIDRSSQLGVNKESLESISIVYHMNVKDFNSILKWWDIPFSVYN